MSDSQEDDLQKSPEQEKIVFPEKAAGEFTWDDEFTKRKEGEERLRSFCEETKDTLNLDPEVLLKRIDDLKNFGSTIYKELYPGGEMIYHNDKHGELTAAAGVEMYLVSLNTLYNTSEKFRAAIKADPSLAEKLLTTNIAAQNFHEAKEWWLRGKDKDTIEASLNKMADKFAELGINLEDVDTVVDLDEFTETLDVSLDKAVNKEYGPDSVFGQDPDLRRELLRESGAVLRTSDFMQSLNKNYLSQIKIAGVSNEPFTTTWGPVALAMEFLNFRPSSLPGDWFTMTEDGKREIFWQNVGASEWIYDTKIKPNLDYAIKYMREINPGAYDELMKRQATLESIVIRDEKRKIPIDQMKK